MRVERDQIKAQNEQLRANENKPAQYPQAVANTADDDLLTAMIQMAVDNKVPGVDKFKSEIARVEQRIKKSVREYLGFGKRGDAKIKYIKKGNGNIYIGEVDADDKENGREIDFYTDGEFWMGRNKDGCYAADKYIRIYPSGTFEVGDMYIDANGDLRGRYTEYKPDGTSNGYDSEL